MVSLEFLEVTSGRMLRGLHPSHAKSFAACATAEALSKYSSYSNPSHASSLVAGRGCCRRLRRDPPRFAHPVRPRCCICRRRSIRHTGMPKLTARGDIYPNQPQLTFTSRLLSQVYLMKIRRASVELVAHGYELGVGGTVCCRVSLKKAYPLPLPIVSPIPERIPAGAAIDDSKHVFSL